MALLTTAFIGCNDDESFDNKIYINSSSKVGTILLQGEDTDEASFNVKMPKVEDRDITFSIATDASQVEHYNEAYYDKAILLPQANYTISNSEVVINAGSILSPEVTVSFTGLTELDRQQKYVLPVTISSSQIGVLQSARTMYYLVKGAALINVVADLDENSLSVNWANNSDFMGMRQFTAEALIKARAFDRELSTIMGIEGHFLIRIGDAGIPPNQLQIVTPVGNFTHSDLAIPVNAWTHIAVTYDADVSTLNVYINGVNKYSSSSANGGSIDWGTSSFWIGKSWDDNRYLTGEASEYRIWKKVLTSAEINETNHFYYVDPAAADLIAYWKFNDGGGDVVTDYSINGNNATSTKPLKWTAVELPAE